MKVCLTWKLSQLLHFFHQFGANYLKISWESFQVRHTFISTDSLFQTYINANLTEHKHDAPSTETLEKAGHVSSAAVTPRHAYARSGSH
jgi:hypothetical protein